MRLVDLGQAPYKEVLELQIAAVDSVVDGHGVEDTCFLVEHPPVITLGKRGGAQYIGVQESFLQEREIDVISTGRGGFITYHAPGQLVVYPVFRLRDYHLSVHDYVWLLEEVMIRTAADFNVKAERDVRNAGVWCEGKKLGSLGIAVRRGVSFHGLALNVDIDLEPFSWLTPCGLSGVAMTSLAEQSGGEVCVRDVKGALWKRLQKMLLRKKAGKLTVNVDVKD